MTLDIAKYQEMSNVYWVQEGRDKMWLRFLFPLTSLGISKYLQYRKSVLVLIGLMLSKSPNITWISLHIVRCRQVSTHDGFITNSKAVNVKA